MPQLKLRKDLSVPGLLKTAKTRFEKIQDWRVRRDFELADVLMSGIAMFTLKSASLLQFDEQARSDGVVQHNLRTLFEIKEAPSDTQMRTILDLVDPRDIRTVFKDIFSDLQRGKILEDFVFFEGHYLLALDGTGYFSSNEVFCDSCCQKTHKDGKITYYHQMLCGVLVHPEKKAVIPLAPEPICKIDGNKKNDCERNAGERFLQDFRREHPHLKVIVTEDGLGSNAPHIATLRELELNFILGCKPGDHLSLFSFIEGSERLGAVSKSETRENAVIHRFRWMNSVALNDSNPDCLVNFLEYWEISDSKTKHWSWVTDIELTEANVYPIMRAGRARWAIENETFNTLKNQGYSFEHNFGHGNKNLSIVLAMLMMVAFLIDQVQQLACLLFTKALEKWKTKRTLWSRMRSCFDYFLFKDWEEFISALAYGVKTSYEIQYDTS